jgi:membrane associated rhomboid family serine protease
VTRTTQPLWRQALLGPLPLAYPLIALSVVYFALAAALSIVIGSSVGDSSAGSLLAYLWSPLQAVQIDMGIGGLLPLANWQPWPLFASIFLHASMSHLIVEMICLLMITPAVEKAFGRLRAFVVFILAGLGGAMASAFYGDLYSLGTSGAIFGLFGASLVYGSLRSDAQGRGIMLNATVWAVLNFTYGLITSGSFASEVGGFVVGIAAALVMIYRIGPGRLPHIQRMGFALASACLICLAVGTGTAISSAWQAWSDPQSYLVDSNNDLVNRFSTVLELTPDDGVAHAMRGAAYALKDDYSNAVPDLDAAFAAGIDSSQLRNLRAWSLYKLGRAADGLADANTALQSAPDDAATLDTRAHIYEDLGRREEAIADYRAALAQNPDIAESKAGLQRLTGEQ